MVQIGLILVLLVVGGAAGGSGIWYLKHQAVVDCNDRWEKDIAEANLKYERAQTASEAELRAATERYEADLAKARDELAVAGRALDLARTKTPLPEPCNLCRIPGDRIWGVQAGGRASSNGDITALNADGSGFSTASAGKRGGLSTTKKNRLHGRRGRAGAAMRARAKDSD